MADTLLGSQLNLGRRIFDKLIELQTPVAISASTAGTGIAFPVTKYNDLVVVVYITAIDATTGDETYVFTVEAATTVGGTYTAIGALPNVRAAGLTTHLIGFNGMEAGKLVPGALFVRINATLGGTTPLLTYGAYIARSVR